MNIEIANRLVELRKKNGLSQEELADKLGLSRQAVSKWERAESSPDTDNLICLAKIYNVSLDDLLDTNQSVEEISKEVKEKSKKESSILRDNLSEEDKKRLRRYDLVEAIFTATLFLIVIVLYLLISFYNPKEWGRLWILFLVPIVLSSFVNALKKRRLSSFNYPVLVLIIFLVLGLYYDLWHPSWILFILIPVCYGITKPIDKMIASKRGEPLDIVDEEEVDKD